LKELLVVSYDEDRRKERREQNERRVNNIGATI